MQAAQQPAMSATVVPCGYLALFVGPAVSVPARGAEQERFSAAAGAHQSFASSAKFTASS